jgi:hypothetical protein
MRVEVMSRPLERPYQAGRIAHASRATLASVGRWSANSTLKTCEWWFYRDLLSLGMAGILVERQSERRQYG